MSKKIKLIDLCLNQYTDLSKKEIISRIIRGEVFVEGEKQLKAGQLFPQHSLVEIRVKKNFFSRGARKLISIFDYFKLVIEKQVFIDAGASTGGFTHSLLEKGARKVYAIDVGYNQLDFSLRSDKRVVVWERRNIMDVSNDDLDEIPDAALCDLSFRSVSGAASHILSLIQSEGWLLALIKPQFEWRNPDSNFDGVINDKKILKNVLLDVSHGLNSQSIAIHGIQAAAQKGTKGNQEYFFLLAKGHQDLKYVDALVMNLF